LNDTHLDCFIYGDRDIYRPGDSIHMNTIVRTEDWKVMKDVPYEGESAFAFWERIPVIQENSGCSRVI
jgi:hypothetical protein